MVSHELRTPLTAIIGYSRLLTRQVHGPLSPRQLEHQEAIFRSAQRLSDLINDLLDVSRLEAGRVELNAAADRRPPDGRPGDGRGGGGRAGQADPDRQRGRRPTCRS